VFLVGILRNVPLAVIVLDGDLQVELWNDVAADLRGLRGGDQHFQSEVNAINRRGRRVRLRVNCVSVPAASTAKASSC